jgi:hypothetical protein
MRHHPCSEQRGIEDRKHTRGGNRLRRLPASAACRPSRFGSGRSSRTGGRQRGSPNHEATQEVRGLGFEDACRHSHKPLRLVQRCIDLLVEFDENAIVLDPFAGTGTTRHAVLDIDGRDGGNRSFIIDVLRHYARTTSFSAMRMRHTRRNLELIWAQYPCKMHLTSGGAV